MVSSWAQRMVRIDEFLEIRQSCGLYCTARGGSETTDVVMCTVIGFTKPD